MTSIRCACSTVSDREAADNPPPSRSGFTSAPLRRLDGGDVDLLHRHHGVERTLRLRPASGKSLGKRARGDLPRETPTVLTPAALTFSSAIADDGVPVAIGLFLIV